MIPKALIFDVDGTLADTERDGHRVAFNRAFQNASLDWHWHADLYGQLLAVGGGKERIKYYCQHFLSRISNAVTTKREIRSTGLQHGCGAGK